MEVCHYSHQKKNKVIWKYLLNIIVKKKKNVVVVIVNVNLNVNKFDNYKFFI